MPFYDADYNRFPVCHFVVRITAQLKLTHLSATKRKCRFSPGLKILRDSLESSSRIHRTPSSFFFFFVNSSKTASEHLKTGIRLIARSHFRKAQMEAVLAGWSTKDCKARLSR